MATATKAKADEKAQFAKDKKVLGERIKAFGLALRKVEKDGHDIAARLVVHAIRYKDVDLATKFLAKFGSDGKSMVRANMFKKWFEKHGPFKWNNESDGFKLNGEKRKELLSRVTNNKTTAEFFSELMKATPWEKDPEKPYMGFDLLKEAKRLINRAKKAEKDHGKDPKTNVKGLAQLTKFIETMDVANEDDAEAEAA